MSADSKFINFYKVLGISKTATQSEIRSAYRKKMIEYHPDKNFTLSKKECENNIKRVVDAYNVLSVSKKREYYDRNYFNKKDSKNDFIGMKDSFQDFIKTQTIPEGHHHIKNIEDIRKDFFDKNKDLIDEFENIDINGNNSKQIIDDLRTQREMQDIELRPPNRFKDIDFKAVDNDKNTDFKSRFNKMFDRRNKKINKSNGTSIIISDESFDKDYNMYNNLDFTEFGKEINNNTVDFSSIDGYVSADSSIIEEDSDVELSDDESDNKYKNIDNVGSEFNKLMKERDEKKEYNDFDNLDDTTVSKYNSIYSPYTKFRKLELDDINNKHKGEVLTLEGIQGIDEVMTKYSDK